jgi:uncharacterized membrane protein
MNKSWLMAGALLLSLAGNAFFAGLLLGRPAGHGSPAMHQQGGAHGANQGPGQRLQQLMARVKQLPAEQRRTVAATVRGYAPQLRELGQAQQQAHQAVQQQLLAPELNREALESAFTSQRQLQGQMHELNQRMLLEIAGQLPAAQRAQLLQREAR